MLQSYNIMVRVSQSVALTAKDALRRGRQTESRTMITFLDSKCVMLRVTV